MGQIYLKKRLTNKPQKPQTYLVETFCKAGFCHPNSNVGSFPLTSSLLPELPYFKCLHSIKDCIFLDRAPSDVFRKLLSLSLELIWSSSHTFYDNAPPDNPLLYFPLLEVS